MRGVFLALLAFGLTGAGEAAPKPMSKNERAYTITLICVAISANENTGDIRSIDAARKMAKTLGYKNERLSRDMLTMASVVGVQLRDEPATVDRNRAICRQLGLVG
jgi:hypothetical protein